MTLTFDLALHLSPPRVSLAVSTDFQGLVVVENDKAVTGLARARVLDPRGFVEPHEDPRDGIGLDEAGYCATPTETPGSLVAKTLASDGFGLLVDKLTVI